MIKTRSWRILCVDDEEIVVKLARRALESVTSEFVGHTDPSQAAREDFSSFDIVISDFVMPMMRGDELLEKIRMTADTPFVFLTNTTDIAIAVELMRRGADDFIQKPIEPANLLFRVERAIQLKQRERQVRMIQREHELLDLENRKLANWRLLYAAKEARQTEQLVSNLARNVNQAGGFLWLDLLNESYEELDENHYRIPKAVLEMSLAAAKNQRKLLEQIALIGSIDEMDLNFEELDAETTTKRIQDYVTQTLQPLALKHGHALAMGKSFANPGTVKVDLDRLQEVLYELCINAIKYSPPESPILVDISQHLEQGKHVFTISVSNYARELQAKGELASNVVGIPYDYLELVFDLFFTIEAFPLYIDEEQWPDGTGLYLARRILKRMDGWVSAHSGLDYTCGDAQPVVRMDVRLPVFPAGLRP